MNVKVLIEVPLEMFEEARKHSIKDTNNLETAFANGIIVEKKKPHNPLTNGDMIEALFPFGCFEGSPHAGCSMTQYLKYEDGHKACNFYDQKWWYESYDGGRTTQSTITE